MKSPNTQPIQIRIPQPGEMLLARWRSSSEARRTMTAQQVHRQIRKNGSVASPNPFFTGRKSESDSYRRLNSAL